MWQPNTNTLSSIKIMIHEAISGASNRRQREIAEEIEKMTGNPEFLCYLALILRDPSLHMPLRLASGHYLKAVIEKSLKPLPQNTYLEECILDSLGSDEIATAVSNIASTLFTAQDGWPRLLEVLKGNLESPLALSILFNVFQDLNVYTVLAYKVEDDPYYGLLNMMIPNLILQVQSYNNVSLKCINQLLLLSPRVLMQYVPRLTDLLFELIKSPGDGEFARELTESLVNLSFSRKDLLSKRFSECAEFMISRVLSRDKLGIRFFNE